MSSAVTPPDGKAAPDAWGQPINDERKAVLRAYLQAWEQEAYHGERRGPFDGIKLTGADVFWLAEQRKRDRFGRLVDVHLEGATLVGARLASANLRGARLTNADLGGARLDGANLSYARLNGADLGGARLDGANLSQATLDHADLSFATLTNANLSQATLDHADLSFATLDHANLSQATLDHANLSFAELDQADLRSATLTSANLHRATLTSVNLHFATLTNANLHHARLANADLSGARITNADFSGATLTNADLRASRMDASTRLEEAIFDQQTQLADVVWNNVPLTRVGWSKVPRLGDEDAITKAKTRGDRIAAIRVAVRAYHGLAATLRAQGLAEATTYRLREQRLLRWQQRLERKYGGWVLSGLLDLISGYGEAPGRIFVAYLVVVLSFAAAYFGITTFGGMVLVSHSDPLKWYEAIVLSLSSFHGRGFFPQTINLGDPVAVVAALEAVFGLFIELILIATFSKRFLGD